MKKISIIYHKNCPDGSTAAAIAYKKFGDSAEYVPCAHGDGLPEEIVAIENKKEHSLYILDFSFSTEVLKELSKEFESVTILDHHISARDAVLSVPGGHFDNDKSGGSLAWSYFFPEEAVPEFVQIIETVDLHKDTDNTLEDISSYINSVGYDLEIYSNLLETFDTNKAEYVKEGKAINRYVGLLEDMVTDSFDIVEFEGVRMPAVDITFDINTKSRILAKLYSIMPPIAMSYRYKGGQWKISLRSNGSFDVTTIVKKYNGGGHAGASGCVIDAPNMEPFFKLVGKYKDGKAELFETL